MLYFNTNVGATLLRSFFHSSRWFGGVFQYQSEDLLQVVKNK